MSLEKYCEIYDILSDPNFSYAHMTASDSNNLKNKDLFEVI